jgi:hypothetical protein
MARESSGIRITEWSSLELKVCLWREEFACDAVQWYSECVTQWDCYCSYAKVRCQETDSGNCNKLRTLVLAAVNWKLWRLAGSAVLFVITCWVYKRNKSKHPIQTPSIVPLTSDNTYDFSLRFNGVLYYASIVAIVLYTEIYNNVSFKYFM